MKENLPLGVSIITIRPEDLVLSLIINGYHTLSKEDCGVHTLLIMGSWGC